MSAIRTDSTKVVYYGDTLINLDTDTVSSSDLQYLFIYKAVKYWNSFKSM